MTQIIGFVWGDNIREQKQLIGRLARKLGIDPATVTYLRETDTGRHSKWLELEDAIYTCRNLILANQQPLLVVSRIRGKRIGLTRNLTALTMLESAGVNLVSADAAFGAIEQIERNEGKALSTSEAESIVKLMVAMIPEAVQKARTLCEAHSLRMQAEMAARKKAGLPVGAENENSQNLTHEDRLIGSERGGEATKQKAIDAYAKIAELIRAKHAEGNSNRQIAKFLNDNNHKTRTGKMFSHVQVGLILKRLES